jgi:hypothetical protein
MITIKTLDYLMPWLCNITDKHCWFSKMLIVPKQMAIASSLKSTDLGNSCGCHGQFIFLFLFLSPFYPDNIGRHDER